MADTWEALAELCRNGVGETGIAANIDRFVFAQDALAIYQTAAKTLFLNTTADTERVRAIIMAGIAYLTADLRRLEPGRAYIGTADGDEPRLPPQLEDSLSTAVLLITAAKINWYQTNHHTGQGRASGYFLKCLEICEIPEPSTKDLNALWKLAHWANTRCILRAAGVTGIEDIIPFAVPEGSRVPGWFARGATDAWAQPSRDVRIRAESFPSGTATHALVLRACQAMAGSTYARVIPRDVHTSYRDLCVVATAISACSARFHIGSTYLTGQPQRVLPVVNPTLQGATHAFLTIVHKDGTLARSPTVARLERNEAIAASFSTIRVSTMKAGSKVTDQIAQITASAFGGDAFAAEDEYKAQIEEVRAARLHDRVVELEE